MQRVPELDERMDDPAQAAACVRANFGEANDLFIRLLRHLPEPGVSFGAGCSDRDICPECTGDSAPRFPQLALRGLTVDGVREQIAKLGPCRLDVSMVGDRHWEARGHLAGAD